MPVSVSLEVLPGLCNCDLGRRFVAAGLFSRLRLLHNSTRRRIGGEPWLEGVRIIEELAPTMGQPSRQAGRKEILNSREIEELYRRNPRFQLVVSLEQFRRSLEKIYFSDETGVHVIGLNEKTYHYPKNKLQDAQEFVLRLMAARLLKASSRQSGGPKPAEPEKPTAGAGNGPRVFRV